MAANELCELRLFALSRERRMMCANRTYQNGALLAGIDPTAKSIDLSQVRYFSSAINQFYCDKRHLSNLRLSSLCRSV
jgi:hypothetical protein